MTAGHAGDASAAEALLADVLTSTDPKASQAPPADANVVVYGDASYGTAGLLEKLESAGIEPNAKVPPPSARQGMSSQPDFAIDTQAGHVCCPAGVRVVLLEALLGEHALNGGDADLAALLG